jgi:Coenzyme PQQ synthesis protein D (PqqD)
MELDLKQRFTKTPEAVVREADDWDCAVIFEPDTPRLCMLNATAWLVYELCDGRTLASIETAYATLFGNKISKEEARVQATSGIQQLLTFKLIEPVSRKVATRTC